MRDVVSREPLGKRRGCGGIASGRRQARLDSRRASCATGRRSVVRVRRREDGSLEREDEWVLSTLQAVKHDAMEHWEDYQVHRALDAIVDFLVEDVSRYYVQQVRERMWAEEESESKTAAYATLYKVLHEVVRMLAPYAPFVTDEIYNHLTGDDEFDTVHMADWPDVRETLREPALEDAVESIRENASDRYRPRTMYYFFNFTAGNGTFTHQLIETSDWSQQ